VAPFAVTLPSPALSASALDSLRRHHLAVIDGYVQPPLVNALLGDIEALRAHPSAALEPPSATNGAVEWFELLPQAPPAPTAARRELYGLVEHLQGTLEALNDGAPLQADYTELKYAVYPTGGHYRRHLDGMSAGERERRFSFILYLNKEWTPSDGGKLRVYEDDDTYFDISPRAGTLVVFRSTTVPHEVLPTTARRTAIVGWLGRQREVSVPSAEGGPGQAAEDSGDTELRDALLRHFAQRGENIAFAREG